LEIVRDNDAKWVVSDVKLQKDNFYFEHYEELGFVFARALMEILVVKDIPEFKREEIKQQ